MERRYDIDWLRVIAIGLLLVYHIGIGFQPWGVFIGFIQHRESLEKLWAPMSMLNVWRIPLLFFVSGMGVCFAMARRSWKELLQERTRRILLPLVFGSLAVVPIHWLLWQDYYSQDLAYKPGPGHLWFLVNIMAYVLILSPLFFYLKKHDRGVAAHWIRRIMGSPLALPLISLAFIAETLLVKPEIYAFYALNLHGFLLGAMAFLSGFLFVFAGDPFWRMLRRWKWLFVAVALVLFLLRYLVFDLEGPDFMKAMETCSWVFAVLALAQEFLNRPGRLLRYLSQAAYPVYILHMFFLYLGSVWLMPLDMPAWLIFLLLVIFTLGGCMLSYEFLVRRVRVLRPLFGLRV